MVTENAVIQYISVTNTALGLDYLLNATWPGINNLIPIEDINAPFIHIGLLTEQLCANVIDLLCCLSIEYQIPIITASDLQSDRPLLEIDPSLITQIDNCVASGQVIPPNFYDLTDRVIVLEQCCFDNTTQINLLKPRVHALEVRISSAEIRINNAETNIQRLFEITSAIPALQSAIELLQQQIGDLIDRCCPVTSDSTCFHYQLLPSQEMVITPNQPVHINLPTKIEDTEPPTVLPGPLWRAKLLGECNWRLEGIVRLRLAQWCVGKKATLKLVVCGVRYILSEYIASSTGFHQAVLSFSNYFIPPGCDNVYLEVSTNDDIAKIIEFAQFKGCGC